MLETVVFSAHLRHAAELLPTMDLLCRRHGVAPRRIEEVYVSAGPGSFTGLRIGLTVARTLAWANGAGVVRVPTLDVVAQNALELPHRPEDLVVLLDAKRGRVYAAAFRLEAQRYHRLAEPAEWEIAALAGGLPAGCAALGEGIAYHRAAVDGVGLTVLPDELSRPRAEVVQRLGSAQAAAGCFDALAALVPTYVRRPEAEEVWERRHAKSRPDPL